MNKKVQFNAEVYIPWFMIVAMWAIGFASGLVAFVWNPHLYNATPKTTDPLIILTLFSACLGAFILGVKPYKKMKSRLLVIGTHTLTGVCFAATLLGLMYDHQDVKWLALVFLGFGAWASIATHKAFAEIRAESITTGDELYTKR